MGKPINNPITIAMSTISGNPMCRARNHTPRLTCLERVRQRRRITKERENPISCNIRKVGSAIAFTYLLNQRGLNCDAIALC